MLTNYLTMKSIMKMLWLGVLFGMFSSISAQSPFQRVVSPVSNLTIDGESFVQRDLSYYVDEVASKTNPDYLQDNEEEFS